MAIGVALAPAAMGLVVGAVFAWLAAEPARMAQRVRQPCTATHAKRILLDFQRPMNETYRTVAGLRRTSRFQRVPGRTTETSSSIVPDTEHSGRVTRADSARYGIASNLTVGGAVSSALSVAWIMGCRSGGRVACNCARTCSAPRCSSWRAAKGAAATFPSSMRTAASVGTPLSWYSRQPALQGIMTPGKEVQWRSRREWPS